MNDTKPSHRPLVALGLPALVAVTLILAALIVRAVPPLSRTRPPVTTTPPVARRAGPAPAVEALRLTAIPRAESRRRTARPTPIWIWSTDGPTTGQRCWLRRRVEVGDVRRAVLRFAADNHATVRVDDRVVATSDDWQRPVRVDLDVPAEGAMTLVVEARNDAGPAAFLATIELVGVDGSSRWITTDAAWEAADEPTFAASRAAVELGPLGTAPWGALASMSGDDQDRELAVLEGFDVELVYVVPRDQGSWVCLATDERGRLYASDQINGLYRLTPPDPGGPADDTVVERIEIMSGGAQGLLVVDGDLLCMVNVGGPEGPGLYRLRDVDGDDRFDEQTLMRATPGGTGEHGVHALALGPDGMLYVAGGNHVAAPEPERSTVPRIWGEDHLLPRLWDARGHAVGVMAPGGWICRTPPEGGPWELVAVGFRNAYDIAFDRRGELFTYDADMEWDMGTPWYRPTRLYHVTSGAEFGWRSGTAKWPEWYPDSLPATLDMGPGSPTGVATGLDTAFPGRYRDALYLCDWTFGTIYAVHLEPRGATYQATREAFLTGRPLPVADAVANAADGALYVVLGGRRVASAVYRIVWRADAVPPLPGRVEPTPAADSATMRRRALEALHREDAPDAIATIWPALSDADRFVRYAARVALEHQPLERWASRAVAEDDRRAALAALLALVRVGDDRWRARAGEALARIAWDDLDSSERLELLRCWALSFIRGGPPSAERVASLRAMLEPRYPSGDDDLDRELCDMLVYLESPVVVARTIPLMERPDREGTVPEIDEELLSRSDAYGQVIMAMATAQPQRQQMHYALALRSAERGWTPPLRRRYFRWFQTARQTSGGLSFGGFLDAIRADALARVPEADRSLYETLGRYERPAPNAADRPRGPGRSWTVAAATALVEDGLDHRSYERGRALYESAQCALCHRFAGGGGVGGPDLTGVATRFTLEDLVATIIEPSRTISDQYEQTEVQRTDGTIVLGRIVAEDDEVLRLMPSMLSPEVTVDVPLRDVVARRPSDVSAMMPFLLDAMAPGEVEDLLAYLLSGGDPRAEVYVPKDAGPWRDAFDGRSLEGWSGDGTRWSVEDGEIVGRTSAEKPLSRNAFLVLDQPLPRDVEIRAEVLLEGDNNSGVQYRSAADGDGRVRGPQCDVHPRPSYNGMLYEEGGRGIVAEQGHRVRIGEDGDRHELAAPAAPIEFTRGTWHEYRVIARGNRIEHRIDGTTTCVVIDQQGTPFGDRLALQLHAGTPYAVRFRSIAWRALGNAR